ncbi:MAG: hypothetical protein AABZ47_14055 [Planctomycetota bacterium]
MTQNQLQRMTLTTSRLMDFCSPKELTAQSGHGPRDWPLVILKELMDNALDACEEARIAPKITVIVNLDGIAIQDNGLGLPESVIDGVVDFAVRISSREAYVAPDRGAQGNALKTILAMPFVLDGKSGRVEITSGGVRHGISMSVDHISQSPVIKRESRSVKGGTGTKVLVCWPDSASSNAADADSHFLQNDANDRESDDGDEEDGPVSACSILEGAKSRFLQMGADYTWLNPHLTLKLDWFGEVQQFKATDPAWRKWRPSDPTCSHWYDSTTFERLLTGYITHNRDHGSDQTVREFVAEFNGLSATAKQKFVLAETELARTNLSALVNGHNLRDGVAGKLLAAMKKHTKPVKPVSLGIIGRTHFERRMLDAGCDMNSFDYAKKTGYTDDGRPWVIECVFGMLEDQEAKRRLVTGVNWSAAIINPFRTLGAFDNSCDTILANQRIDANDPVILVLHAAIVKPQYTDRGKSAIVMANVQSGALITSLEKVTGRWTKQRKCEERHAAARASRRDAMVRARRFSLKDAAWSEMDAAYAKASANGTLPAHARQIMYAARGEILRLTSMDQLNDAYFTQNLLPNFVAENEHAQTWDVVYDARGCFIEPHSHAMTPLGTISVREYLQSVKIHEVADPEVDVAGRKYPTCGPLNRFGAILFIEKEGFFPLLDRVKLAKRYDLALMSTKGVSNVASRCLVDSLCGQYDIPLLVLHDCDVDGLKILETLRESTQRYEFRNRFRVVDLGLRLADVTEWKLEAEPVRHSRRVDGMLKLYGASQEEIDFLTAQRVELNAFTSDAFVKWLEAKLADNGVQKIVPDQVTLEDAYRRAVHVAELERAIENIGDAARGAAAAAKIPRDLGRRVKSALKADPTLTWDEAVMEAVGKKRRRGLERISVV